MTTPPAGRPNAARPGLEDDALGARDQGQGGSLIRSEEQLITSVERHPAARVTLRKRVVEEEQTITVTLRREEVDIVEEDLRGEGSAADEAGARTAGRGRGGRITAEQTDGGEIILYAERPVVTTEWVPVERVRLERTSHTVDETVTAEVAREVVELVDERDPAFTREGTQGTQGTDELR